MIEYPYHMHVKMMSRSKGHSAVAAAAYRAGARLTEGAEPIDLSKTYNQICDEEDDNAQAKNIIAHDYRRRSGVMSSFIMTPKNAPQWSNDRSLLWNAVERAENRKDAQLAREVVVSLPNVDIFDHLTPENKIKRQQEFYEKILKTYVKDNFIAEGMIADVALHMPAENNNEQHFHAHIMLTTREIGADGFGKKDRSWNDAKKLEAWRENYAKVVNDALSAKNVKAFIDHRTYEERGLDYGATKPLGAHNFVLERFGKQTQIGNDNRQIRATNRVEHKYLEKVFEHSPIAPIHEIEHAVQRAGFSDPETVIDNLMEEGKLKRLTSAETGHVTDMYSFTPMVQRLNKIKAKSEHIHARKGYIIPQEIINDAVKARGDKKVREALHYVAQKEGFKVIETENTGHKTTFISAAADMYQKAGYEVVKVARNNQGKDAFKQAGLSKGILTYRDFLRRFGERYTGAKSQTQKVILVDDADGLSPLQDQEIFNTAQKINAKLIYIGNQKKKNRKKLWQSLFSYYKKITAFKRLREKFFKSARQTATIRETFMEAKTLKALEMQSAKYLRLHKTTFAAKRALLDDWFKNLKKKDDKRFILTSTDADAQVFNFEIQKQRIEKKHLKENTARMFTVSYRSDRGSTLKRDMSVHWGDMIQFKKTYNDIGIDEGARARVLNHRHDHSLLEMDDGRLIEVDLVKHNGFDLGYAGRMVSQGSMLEQGYLYHSKANASDDAPLLYQHSEKPVRLFTDEQTAPDITELSAQLLGRGHDFYEGYEEESEDHESDTVHGFNEIT